MVVYQEQVAARREEALASQAEEVQADCRAPAAEALPAALGGCPGARALSRGAPAQLRRPASEAPHACAA